MNGKVVMYDMKKGQPIKRAGQVHEIANLPVTRKNPYLNPERKRLKVAEVSQAKLELEKALEKALSNEAVEQGRPRPPEGPVPRRPYSQLNSQYERLQLEMAKAAETVRVREQENKAKREKRKQEQLMEDMKARLEKQEHRKKYLKIKAFYPKFLPND